jgi:hypothetical protein
MDGVIGGVVTGIVAAAIINFSVGRLSLVLAILVEIAGAGAVVYFGFISKVLPFDFSIACLISYLIASFIVGWIIASLNN